MRNLSKLFFLPLLFLCGCVTTNYFAKMNPEFAGMKYQRVLIQFIDLEPGFAQYGEQAAKKEIHLVFGKKIECYLVSDEFYTGIRARGEMKADIEQFVKDKRIDATLICVVAQAVKKETNVLSNPSMNGIPIYANNDQKNIGYRMELFDQRVKKSVWYSSAHMEGNSLLNSFQGMMNGFIKKSVTDLKENDLLGVDERPNLPKPDQTQDKFHQEI